VITGSSRIFAILGDPVSHSLSPTMHNAAFRVLGLNAVYVPLRCSSDDLSPLLRGLAAAGGGGNITVPHKDQAARAVDVCRPPAESLGACNTFWSEDGRIVGDNTDVAGLLDALHQLDLPRRPWFVAGTGGGAKAAVSAAGEYGVGVAIGSRDPERQRRFGEWVASRGVPLVPPADCGVLINATPLGLAASDPLPIQPDHFPRAEVAFDLVYARGETRWVRAMRSKLRKAADGRTMLVAQGAAAFERWYPGRKAPIEVMRAAVNVALR
jgi:shikimate dehydrogenase